MVEGDDGEHRLVHGTTLHGAQIPTVAERTEPSTYYHRTGPIGLAVEALRGEATRRVAVIGLGTGTMACHSRAGERWTFFEIDPKVERIARDPGLFTYLRDCPGRFDVVLGDARLSLERARGERFGLIVADAFSSDAIPVHLVTREALALYVSRLAPGGALAFHTSNRYLELDPVLGDLAADAGLRCRARSDFGGGRFPSKAASSWVVMARAEADLRAMARDERFGACPRSEGAEVWTDDYSNLVELLD